MLVNEDEPLDVKNALLGINQLLEEEGGQIKHPPPATASPFTRQFLRLFEGRATIPQDQVQKLLKGTGYAAGDFVKHGWCTHDRKKKAYLLVSPFELAQTWHGRHRQGMLQDYDQASFLIGACFDDSGINASDTLNNDRFQPHPALGALLEWL